MQVVIQRVSQAKVEVEQAVVGAIGKGLVVLVAYEGGDSETTNQKLFDKLVNLRIFSDERGKMNRSLKDVNGALLIISQFTLAANLHQGNRPGFTDAMPPQEASALYQQLCDRGQQEGIPVATGRFGHEMQVHLVNDGPVTFHLCY